MRKPVPILAILRPKTVERFKDKLRWNNAGCLEFTGTTTLAGYGVVDVSYGNKTARYTILAHRLAWAVANGTDPPDDKIICHTCNNPACCHPKHLYAGTSQTNADDMVRAGRQATNNRPWLGKRGASHPRHKDYKG